MQLWHAIVIGVVQGFTEFLPVSSSGHLVLADRILHLPLEGKDALGFDVLLHAASLLAVLIMYASVWKNLVLSAVLGKRDAWVLIFLLIIATIPGAVAGIALEDTVSEMRSFLAVGIGFLLTSAVLVSGEWFGKRGGNADVPLHRIGVLRSIIVGCAQAVAILPGVSRSGSTMSTLRALGLTRSVALDFSFLMAVPIITGAVAKTSVDVWTGDIVFPSSAVSVTGFLASFVVSACAIWLLKYLVVRRSLAVFSWYLLPVGIACVVWGIFRS